jgi:excisionase family DNA binding protein
MKTILDLKYYTVSDLIKKLPLTKLSVRKYIKAGKIKAIKIGTSFYVSEENLKLFLSDDQKESGKIYPAGSE